MIPWRKARRAGKNAREMVGLGCAEEKKTRPASILGRAERQASPLGIHALGTHQMARPSILPSIAMYQYSGPRRCRFQDDLIPRPPPIPWPIIAGHPWPGWASPETGALAPEMATTFPPPV
jgi:hypothetical protein